MSKSRVLSAVLMVMVTTYSWPAHASIFGEENGALSTLVAQGVAELVQVGEFVSTASEQLQLARDVYAGVNEFINFDPQAFFDGQKSQWLAEVPLAADVQSFVQDVSSNGLKGGRFNARDIYSRFDAYRDAYRRKEATRSLGGTMEPFDSKIALSAAQEAEQALSNVRSRQQLASHPEPETVAEGLFAVDLARGDQRLLALYMQRRATAKEAEYQAFKLYAESLDASPGKAQQLSAMAAGMSAQQLARIDDKLTQSVAFQQLDRQETSTLR